MSSSVGMQVRVYFQHKWQSGQIVQEETKNGSKFLIVKNVDGTIRTVNTRKDKYIIVGKFPSVEADVRSQLRLDSEAIYSTTDQAVP